MRRITALLIATVIVLAIFAIGCGEGKKNGRTSHAERKVLFIGLDGATWRVIDPLIKAGRMPNMKRLVDGGTSGILKSVEPMDSPILWTSMATGKSMEKHGVTGFVEKVPGEYETAVVSSLSRRVKALWNILSDRGDTVGVVNWWATHPAEKVNGEMVAETVFFNAVLSSGKSDGGSKGETYPPRLYDEIKGPGAVPKEFMLEKMRAFGLEPMDMMDRSLGDFIGNEDAYRQYILQNQILADESVERVGSYIYRKYDPDFMAVYFEGTDVISHFFWKYMRPEDFNVAGDRVDKYGRVIEDYYAYIDTLIGRLLENIDDDTVVIIASDHGMTTDTHSRRIYNLNFILGKLGYMEFNDGETDWSKTRLFNLSENENWFATRDIYVNLSGRESKGFVKPGVEHRDLVTKAAAELGKVVTADGRKVFDKVEIVDVDGGSKDWRNPALRVSINTELPDTGDIIIHGKSYPISRFIAPRYISGGHSINGVFAAYGKDIKKSFKVQGASIMDMTPTVLYLMGVPVAKDMDGRALTEIVDDKARKDVAFTDSYESGTSARKDETPSALTKEQKDKLRSLGYVQ